MNVEGQRPEIEELSDLQWARLERGLWARMDAEGAAGAEAASPSPRIAVASARGKGHRRAVAIAGTLALAAVLLLALFWSRRPGEELLGATVPARVVTGASATTVSFAEAAIEVQARSALLLSGSAQAGATVVLERGGAGFRVAPRATPFVVVAGDVSVRVVGTRFTVARAGEDVTVAVREGKVAVLYRGEVQEVLAGSRWESKVAPRTELFLDDAGAADAADTAESAESTDAADAADAADAVDAVADAGAHAATRAGSATRAAGGARQPSPRREDQGGEDALDAAAARAAAATAKAADAQQAKTEFAAAAGLESANPQEALHRYLILAQRSDRWGANALFAAARLAVDLGERERGSALATAYLRRFPRGLNAVDAAALLEAAR